MNIIYENNVIMIIAIDLHFINQSIYIFKMFIQFKPKKHTYSIVIYSLHLYILFLITYFTYIKLLRCYTQFKTNYVMNYSNIVFIDYKIAKFYY